MKGLGKNIASLAGGNIAAQVISLLAVPVITRLYTTEEFGVFSAFISVVLMLVPVSTLRFNSALVVTKKDRHAANLLVLSLFSVVFICVLLSVILLIIDVNDGGGVLQQYLWLLPVVILIQGFVQSFQFWALRLKIFKNVAIAQISESVTDRSIVILLGGMQQGNAVSLIYGRVFGPLINMVMLIKGISRFDAWPNFSTINRKTLVDSLKRYKDFPLFSSWAFFANSAARESPVIILAILYTPVVAGLYGLGLRVLNMPMLMIGDALSKVLLSRMREHVSEPLLLGRVLLKIFTLVSYMGMLLMVIMIALGSELFLFVFGNEWREAGTYAAILSPAIMLMLGYRITSVLFDLYEKQRQRMFFDVSLLFVRIVTLGYAGYTGMPVFDGLFFMMVATSVLYAAAIIYLMALVQVQVLILTRRIMKSVLLIMPMILGVVFLNVMGYERVVLVISLCMLGLAQCCFIYYFDKNLFKSETVQ